METTRQRCLAILTNKGMFDREAEAVLAKAMPKIEVGGYQMTWERPASEYPDALYAVIGMILNNTALEWIDENCPMAWYRPLFAGDPEAIMQSLHASLSA